jgi:hypothetical protein
MSGPDPSSAPDAPLFERMALIGMGLIGSSLARAVISKGLVRSVVGCARSEATRDKALELGLAESMFADPGDAADGADLVVLCTPLGAYAFADPGDAADGADLVVLCTPLGAYAEIAQAIGPRLAAGSIVTDVGSVKQAAIRDVGPQLPAMSARSFPMASISCPATRSPAPNTRAPKRDLRNCSRTAGASSRRRREPIPRPWTGSAPCGGAAAPRSKSWSRPTTTR